MSDKIVVVTGANKGIGLTVVKELCKRNAGIVYLTARDEKRGADAVESLKKEGYSPRFHQLDITDRNSVKTFADYLKKEHNGLDILINNAGVIEKYFFKTTYEDFQHVVNINYRGNLIVQEFLFPLLNKDARVINISSNCGHISNIRNSQWTERLTKKDLKLEDIDAFVQWALDAVKNGTVDSTDFAEMVLIGYKVSKVAVSALTILQQNSVDRNISVNCVHPGYVKTDMTKNTGFLTAEEAADTVLYVVLDIDQSIKGKFFWNDKTIKEWDPSIQAYPQMKRIPEPYMDVLKSTA